MKHKCFYINNAEIHIPEFQNTLENYFNHISINIQQTLYKSLYLILEDYISK